MPMTDEQLLDLLVECDGRVHDVAEHLVDLDVSGGEYEGCSSELEMAYDVHVGRLERVLAQAGGA